MATYISDATYNAGIESLEVVNQFRFLDGACRLMFVHLQCSINSFLISHKSAMDRMICSEWHSAYIYRVQQLSFGFTLNTTRCGQNRKFHHYGSIGTKTNSGYTQLQTSTEVSPLPVRFCYLVTQHHRLRFI